MQEEPKYSSVKPTDTSVPSSTPAANGRDDVRRSPRPAVSWADSLLAPIRESGAFILVVSLLYFVNSLLTGYPSKDKLEAFGQLLLGLYLYVAALKALPAKWRRWLRGAGYVVMYALCSLESFLALRFNMRISPSMIMLCLDTTGTESREFLLLTLKAQETWTVVTVYAHLLLVHLFVELRAWRWRWLERPLRLTERALQPLQRFAKPLGSFAKLLQRPVITLISIAVFAGAVASVPKWVKRQQSIVPFLLLPDSRDAEQCSEVNFYSAPLRLLWSAKFYSLMRNEAEEIAANTKNVQVDGCSFDCPKIVLIIGESYNKHHASLYGYPLATTPRQQALADSALLYAFTDAVSPWNLTSNVFKDLMSTHSCNEPGRWTDGVIFPAVFKHAGYHVAFLSNQFYAGTSQSNCDVNGSFFLNRSDMDALCFNQRSTHHYTTDGKFLEVELKPYVHHDRELVIVHLYGQHMNYADRAYFNNKPKPFGPADYKRPDLNKEEVQTLVDYDNATEYNDRQIRYIYDLFAHEDVVFVYVADHGEYVYDGADHRWGRNHSSEATPEMARYEFEVPLTVFFSRTFREQHPDVVARVEAARTLPVGTDDVPHLLMGLAGLKTPHYNPRHDPLSPDYDASRRRILRGHEDYDKIMKTATNLPATIAD